MRSNRSRSRAPTPRSTLARALTACAFAALLSDGASAQSPCRAPSADCVVVGKLDISVAFGAGVRTNPLHKSSDIPLVVIPQISYYGERFFWDNLEFGFTLFEGKSHTFNMIAAPGYDRVFFFRDDLQNVFVSGTFMSLDGPPLEAPLDSSEQFRVRDRKTTYLAGPEWLFRFGEVIGQLDVLKEVTGRHDGYEVRAAVAAPIVQSRSSLVASAGFTWKSKELVDYYYGVPGLYEPDAALNPFVKVGYALPLAERWTFSAFAHYERLGGEIFDSPIVADHGVTTVFAGFVFKVY